MVCERQSGVIHRYLFIPACHVALTALPYAPKTGKMIGTIGKRADRYVF
ncbi:hypothetical protein LRHMDP3_2688 [Lacticaseibacillus rhamnosus LRHMDP3]|uniref:Uncharacterized protein n=1 Tax=Lacticaseibacillus rhamnosus LRHMDP3 TaxID=1203259 RepID=A0AB33XQV9_LACRH|nr:hypothetical protein LRHMDP3_2688 [Lacticaseibacillus rhamnosus LRHMDP3]